MSKFLRFFLSLSLLFLSGYRQSSGQAHHVSICHVTGSLTERPFGQLPDLQTDRTLFFEPSAHDADGENTVNHVAEFEEKKDEHVYLKKYIAIGSGLQATSGAPVSTIFRCGFRQFTYVTPVLSYIPYYRALYLKFEVIRI